MRRHKYLTPLTVALLLMGACTSETQTQVVKIVPVKPEFSAPTAQTELDFSYSNGSAPGGANDCLKGFWLFVFNYQLMNGDSVESENAAAFCKEEITMRALDGSLQLGRGGPRIESEAVITFLMTLDPIDSGASECLRLYGTLACK